MRSIPRLIAFCLAALLLLMCGAATAQPGTSGVGGTIAAAAAAPTPEPTVAELRAQFAKISTDADSTGDLRQLLAQISDIGTQADKFVAARTGELADLNARLGELGNPPAAGAPPEDPDITRQRAALLLSLIHI